MKNYYPKLSKVNIIAILAFFVCTILLLGFSYAKPSLYSISSLEFRGVSYNLSWYNKASVQKSSIEGKVGQVDFAAAVSELIIDNKNNEGVPPNKVIEIYKIKNCKIGFRIAVKEANKYLLFEVDNNPKAKYGSDLLDIKNKVSYIGISDVESGLPEYCFIKDNKTINNMVNIILKSKVINNGLLTQSTNYYLTFHLKDSTKTLRFFSGEANALDGKIKLTKDFGKYVKAIVDKFNFEKHKYYESSNASLKSLSIVMPKNWHLDSRDKNQYFFVDETGKNRGSIVLDDYQDYINFQQNNHSSMLKDEYINIPIGKCRLITMDTDNGTAASGITGTHNEYFAIIPIKGMTTYRLNFSKMDKKMQTKEQFIELLKNLRRK